MNPFRRADHADTERLLDSAPARVDATLDQGPSITPAEVDANSPEAHLSARTCPRPSRWRRCSPRRPAPSASASWPGRTPPWPRSGPPGPTRRRQCRSGHAVAG